MLAIQKQGKSLHLVHVFWVFFVKNIAQITYNYLIFKKNFAKKQHSTMLNLTEFAR